MWITPTQARELVHGYSAPLFVYSADQLRQRATLLTNLQLPFNYTVRFAVKANPHPQIISIFAAAGLHFDASSSYEAAALINQGIVGDKISLSSQQPAHNLDALLAAGVRYVATSLHQLELFAAAASANATVGLRVNPGIGAGHNNRTRTGGVSSSFGLWHDYLDDALGYARDKKVLINRLHVHIGSGADPAVWGDAMDAALEIATRMPDVTTLDIGGGYKIARTSTEQEADMPKIAELFGRRLSDFAAKTGRELHLEIEPGSWLVAHAGVLLAEVVDIVDTGAQGFTFLRVNTGMNDFMRPSMYGAQHQMEVFAKEDVNGAVAAASWPGTRRYIVAGHNCETGDILTPAPGNPEALAPRLLNQAAIGDILAIADVGAYCASFSAKGYNAFPNAIEIVV